MACLHSRHRRHPSTVTPARKPCGGNDLTVIVPIHCCDRRLFSVVFLLLSRRWHPLITFLRYAPASFPHHAFIVHTVHAHLVLR